MTHEPTHDDQAVINRPGDKRERWQSAHDFAVAHPRWVYSFTRASFEAGYDQAIREERARVEALVKRVDAAPTEPSYFRSPNDRRCFVGGFMAALTTYEEHSR